MRRHDTTASIWARALIYLSIVAGGWLVALPADLLTLEHRRPTLRLRGPLWVAFGTASCAAATVLGLVSGSYLIVCGWGTPLPLDPPRNLVTSGPYRIVRNPQAIAMVLAVVGEVAAIRSRLLWTLLPLTLIYLEVLVGPWEERQLAAQHGDVYLTYKRRVRRWLPQISRKPADTGGS